jgi:hypothetical protein
LPLGIPSSLKELAREAHFGRSNFEGIVFDLLTNFVDLPLSVSGFANLQKYQGDVLDPLFSTDLLLDLLDKLQEFNNLHSDLSATIESISCRLAAADKSRRPSKLRCSCSAVAPKQSAGPARSVVRQRSDAIFERLARQQGGDLAELGIVTVTGNSLSENHARDLPGVIHHYWDRCWVSENAPGSWIEIDFGERSVFVTSYFLKTYRCAEGYSHLRSWVLEGLARGRCVILDERNNRSELNGRSRSATYDCSSPALCKAVRLRQVGPNHRGDHYLVLRRIELFGELMEDFRNSGTT